VNKSELVGRVSESIDGGRTVASHAVEAVIETIQEAVSRGEKVAISGFGVFERVERAARIGRNPATGAPVQVKASAVPKFRPGAEFKGVVSGARGKVSGKVKVAAGGARSTARKTVKAAAAAVVPKAVKATKKAAPAKKAVAAKKAAPAKKAVAAKKVAPAKKAVAAKKVAPAKKAVAKKAPAKAPAKKAVAKKAPAKAPAKKAVAKKAPAKRAR
jgi:DNA-binding protein HU-beta